jgi:hypothetical protein
MHEAFFRTCTDVKYNYMVRESLLFGVLLLAFVSCTTLESSSTPQNSLQIKHVYNYVDENKIMHVLGELQNIGNNAMTNVTVGAVFTDTEGDIINEYSRSPELRTINPGLASPFEILFIDIKNVDKVKNFKLHVNGTEGRPVPVNLQVKVDSSRQDIIGFYYINGIIFNSADTNANNSIAVATLYDKDGRVIAIGRGLAEPKDISSNSSANFGLAIIDKLQTPKGKSYSVVADSDSYVSIPTNTQEK